MYFVGWNETDGFAVKNRIAIVTYSKPFGLSKIYHGIMYGS